MIHKGRALNVWLTRHKHQVLDKLCQVSQGITHEGRLQPPLYLAAEVLQNAHRQGHIICPSGANLRQQIAAASVNDGRFYTGIVNQARGCTLDWARVPTFIQRHCNWLSKRIVNTVYIHVLGCEGCS